jgi:4-hydroxymandelate oxidase
MTDFSSFANLAELEGAARRVLPRGTFDYFASGANDEITLRENIAAFERLRIRFRVLVDVSQRDTGATVLGTRLPAPILIAPMAFQRLAHADGELATARGAGEVGVGMVLSTFSTTPVRDVRAATRGPLWFQLYIYRDRAMTRALIERVDAEGCEALVLTVDAPVIGRRERDVRNRFHLPADIVVPNALPGARQASGDVADSKLAMYVTSQIDPAISWRDVEWLRSITRLPIVIKGIVRGDDAARAVALGAAAVIVSNHGGRQLDTCVATIDALPDVVQAVGGAAEVLVDGGVRRGTDVVKALALGARAVLVGRPVLWGLALGGAEGVSHVLRMLSAEYDTALALCGCQNASHLTRDLIA